MIDFLKEVKYQFKYPTVSELVQANDLKRLSQVVPGALIDIFGQMEVVNIRRIISIFLFAHHFNKPDIINFYQPIFARLHSLDKSRCYLAFFTQNLAEFQLKTKLDVLAVLLRLKADPFEVFQTKEAKCGIDKYLADSEMGLSGLDKAISHGEFELVKFICDCPLITPPTIEQITQAMEYALIVYKNLFHPRRNEIKTKIIPYLINKGAVYNLNTMSDLIPEFDKCRLQNITKALVPPLIVDLANLVAGYENEPLFKPPVAHRRYYEAGEGVEDMIKVDDSLEYVPLIANIPSIRIG